MDVTYCDSSTVNFIYKFKNWHKKYVFCSGVYVVAFGAIQAALVSSLVSG
jgi:hypothetical protein